MKAEQYKVGGVTTVVNEVVLTMMQRNRHLPYSFARIFAAGYCLSKDQDDSDQADRESQTFPPYGREDLADYDNRQAAALLVTYGPKGLS